jgi:hypothetical protein
MAWCRSIGHSPKRQFKNNGGRAIVLSDDADALFFRAVDRNRRHNMPARPHPAMRERVVQRCGSPDSGV